MQLKPINQKVWKCGNALVVSIDSSISQILGIEEGDILQIKIIGIEKPKITQTQVSPPEKLVEDNIERGAMLEITLPDPNVPGNIPSWKEYCLIPLSEKTGTRYFFPGYKVPFKIETDIGEIHTYVTAAVPSIIAQRAMFWALFLSWMRCAHSSISLWMFSAPSTASSLNPETMNRPSFASGMKACGDLAG